MADAPQDLDAAIARRGRVVALVIAGTMVLWLGASVLGPMLGLPGRYAFLFDFAALAALAWALVNVFRMRRLRRESQRETDA